MGEEGYSCISITTCTCINTSYVVWLCLVVCLLVVWVDNWLFVYFCFECFYIASFDHYFFCVKNPKMHKKIENRKVWSTLLSFISKHVLPCTFVLMALYIYEYSLFPMHLYPCGRTLNIYVTIVNRSSNLSWMISEWFCWSWDMHRFVPIYLSTYLFYCFCLISSPNVNLQMKRDIELQKPVAHTSIWLEKRESNLK